MSSYNATEWTLLLSAISASIVSILYTVSKSRCTTVDCGCIHCKRDVLPIDENEDPRISIPAPSAVSLDKIEHSLSPNVRQHVRKIEFNK